MRKILIKVRPSFHKDLSKRCAELNLSAKAVLSKSVELMENSILESLETKEEAETNIEKMTVSELKEFIFSNGGSFSTEDLKADLLTIAKHL